MTDEFIEKQLDLMFEKPQPPTIVQPKLVEYGVQNEESDIRAHVAVYAQKVYCFPTASAIKCIKSGKYAPVNVNRFGVVTAQGYRVPVDDLEDVKHILIEKERFEGFTEELSTSEKGERAVMIVRELLMTGRFPFWLQGNIIAEKSLQIKGLDILVDMKARIQVKCDYRAGKKDKIPGKMLATEFLCTGNVFLQISECNPFKEY